MFSAVAQGAAGPPQHQPRELRQPGTAQGQATQLAWVRRPFMCQVLHQAAGHRGCSFRVHRSVHSAHVAVGVPVPEASAPFIEEDVLEQGDGEPKGPRVPEDVLGR